MEEEISRIWEWHEHVCELIRSVSMITMDSIDEIVKDIENSKLSEHEVLKYITQIYDQRRTEYDEYGELVYRYIQMHPSKDNKDYICKHSVFITRRLFEKGSVDIETIKKNVPLSQLDLFGDVIPGYYDFPGNTNKLKMTPEWAAHGLVPNSLRYNLKMDDLDFLISYSTTKSLNEPVLSGFYEDSSNSISSPLNIAALYGSVKCFRYLILNGAKADESTMLWAISGGNLEIVRLCEQCGVKITESEANRAAQFFRFELLDWIQDVHGILGHSVSNLATYNTISLKKPQSNSIVYIIRALTEDINLNRCVHINSLGKIKSPKVAIEIAEKLIEKGFDINNVLGLRTEDIEFYDHFKSRCPLVDFIDLYRGVGTNVFCSLDEPRRLEVIEQYKERNNGRIIYGILDMHTLINRKEEDVAIASVENGCAVGVGFFSNAVSSRMFRLASKIAVLMDMVPYDFYVRDDDEETLEFIKSLPNNITILNGYNPRAAALVSNKIVSGKAITPLMYEFMEGIGVERMSLGFSNSDITLLE